MEKPQIPKDVLEDIGRVRDVGEVNMLDIHGVAIRCGPKARKWIMENKELFAKLIFQGPEAFDVIQ